jgi:hypothetical protein
VLVDCDICPAFMLGAVPGARPDFVILDFTDADPRGRWCIIEMKNTLQHARGIQTQLQAAADLITEHQMFAISGSPRALLPLVLLSKGAKTQEVTLLGKLTIRLFGNPFPIVVKRCGIDLADLPNVRPETGRNRR